MNDASLAALKFGMNAPLPSFAEISRRCAPNPLVVEALALLAEPVGQRALDLGAGRLNDTRLMLAHGLVVDAVDRDPQTAAIAARIGHLRLNAVQGDLRDFPVAEEAYALIVAIHVFPFLTRADFRAVAARVVSGLAPGGRLCCTLFGHEDEWAPIRPRMMFLTASEVRDSFADIEPVVLRERMFNGLDANQRTKRWHVHQCIFRKR